MELDSLAPVWRWSIAAPIYVVAYAAAAGVFFWMARRRGFDDAVAWRIMLAGLIGGLAGANLVQLFATGLPGKTIEGGILGGWLAVEFAKRRFGVARSTGDLFALAIPLGEAIGRIACFIGGCCYGKVAAGLPWLVQDHGALRHPTQLYTSVAAAASFAFLLWIERRGFLGYDRLLYVGGMLFCADRFVIEFFRAGATVAGSLTLAQLGCMVGFAVFAAMFVRRARLAAAA